MLDDAAKKYPIPGSKQMKGTMLRAEVASHRGTSDSLRRPMKSCPARLHVILARAARTGVVIRRGPSKSVAVIGWNRRTDEFQLGQWLRGRIYERRCDLSPDGKWFIYFAMNGRWQSESKGSWTAISRAPYLKAVIMLPKGDCWNGGGLFTSDHSYWLNHGPGDATLADHPTLNRNTKWRPEEFYGGECPGVYYVRLQRDGWTLTRRRNESEWNDTTVFEKAVPGGWTLRKFAHEQVGAPPGKGCYWDEHELAHAATGTLIPGKDWEWADVDGKRLAWAANGRLWAGYVRKGGVHDAACLHDFRDMKFEALTAPY